MLDEAGDFIEIIRDVIRQELNIRDKTSVAVVESVNANGTLNLYVLPDMDNVVHNVTNQCRYNFKPGDTATLFSINGKTNNSFVVAQHNPQNDFLFKLESELDVNAINPEVTQMTEGILELGTTWTTSGGDTYQDVELSGVTPSDNLFLTPCSKEDKEALDGCDFFCQLNSNRVRFYASATPSSAVTFNYVILRNMGGGE